MEDKPTGYKRWTSLNLDGEIPFRADDLLPHAMCTITSASMTSEGWLAVTINEEKLSEPVDLEFPSEYLRFNCECPDCFTPSTMSHSLVFDLMLEPVSMSSVNLKVNKVEVTFSNDHVTCFSADWLYQRRMTEEGAAERNASIYLHNWEPWSDDDFNIQSASLKEISETPEGFLRLAKAMHRDGIFIITDCPDRQILPKEFSDLTGLVVSPTHYGEKFDVISERIPVNLAYTAKKLALHIDLPNMTRCPRIQMLHCLVQCDTGGANTLTDGLKAAKVLQENHPEMYEILTTQNMEFEGLVHTPTPSARHESYHAHSTPIIVLDKKGKLDHLQWTGETRSSFFNGSPQAFAKWMEALKTYYRLLLQFSIKLKTKPGEMLMFDNLRVMHGRNSFDPTQHRQLEGSYTDWDYLNSRLRVALSLIAKRKRNSKLNKDA